MRRLLPVVALGTSIGPFFRRWVLSNPLVGSRALDRERFQLLGRCLPIVAGVAFSSACSPPPDAAGRQAGLEGVWEVRELAFMSHGGTRVNRNPLPGQAMFSSAHYSLIWMLGDTAMRQFEVRWTPTDAEKVRRYGEIIVNSGRYIRQGSALTLWPSVSRVPEFMDGGRLLYEYRRSADTLWLTSLDEYSYDGVQAPWAAAGNHVTLKLVRVEDF